MNATRAISAAQGDSRDSHGFYAPRQEVPPVELPAGHPWREPPDLEKFPRLRRSYVREARRPEEPEHKREHLFPDREQLFPDEEPRSGVFPTIKPHAALERATVLWRYHRERHYRARAAAARTEHTRLRDAWAMLASVGQEWGHSKECVAEEKALVSRIAWNEGRAGAQMPRFDSVRACASGVKTLHIRCRCCSEKHGEPIPCTCGVVRVCEACAEDRAERLQKRIAAARARELAEGYRNGLFYRKRRGGAFSEKMLTLTVPHFELEDCGPEVNGPLVTRTGKPRPPRTVREAARGFFLGNTVSARIAAIRLAWPKMLRTLRRWLVARGLDTLARKSVKFYRLFEWTRGHDGKGHPHFHVYLFSPWLSHRVIARAWAAALVAVGVPLKHSCEGCRGVPEGEESCPHGEGRPHARTDLRKLDGFNWQALRELVKSGDRRAIEQRIGAVKSPSDVEDYAGGWTMSDAFPDFQDGDTDAARDLYVALEGRRLAQGARGFLLPLARSSCEWCGQSIFAAAVHFVYEGAPLSLAPFEDHPVLEPRGPP